MYRVYVCQRIQLSRLPIICGLDVNVVVKPLRISYLSGREKQQYFLLGKC